MEFPLFYNSWKDWSHSSIPMFVAHTKSLGESLYRYGTGCFTASDGRSPDGLGGLRTETNSRLWIHFNLPAIFCLIMTALWSQNTERFLNVFSNDDWFSNSHSNKNVPQEPSRKIIPHIFHLQVKNNINKKWFSLWSSWTPSLSFHLFLPSTTTLGGHQRAQCSHGDCHKSKSFKSRNFRGEDILCICLVEKNGETMVKPWRSTLQGSTTSH